LLKIQKLMVLFSVQLYWEAIRQLFLLLLAIMNTGLFISLLETYTTMSAVHIAMALCFLVFLQFQKVCHTHIRKQFLCLNKIFIANHAHQNSADFRKFRRQLLHSSLARILESLKPFMTEPDIVRCADGYFRRVIYGLGPYIADYPEQALLACIVQGWCPR
jgi:Plavaka transposase